MPQKNLRTYHRRKTTRKSGYHTCDAATGGECVIVRAERYQCRTADETFVFTRNGIELVELFERGVALIAFGGYIFSKRKAEVSLKLTYSYEGQDYCLEKDNITTIGKGSWAAIGIHAEQWLNKDLTASNIAVEMTITAKPGNVLDFIAFDLDTVSKNEFLDTSCAKSFYQKTKITIPYLYYLRSDLPFDQYLADDLELTEGQRVVMKSCNRCGRYLPINIDDEMKTLSYSLHCKKKAPCTHSTFRAYKIRNRDDLEPDDLEDLTLKKNKVVSYYGHQLEKSRMERLMRSSL